MSRRWKVVFISDEVFLSLFTQNEDRDSGWMAGFKLKGVPEGCKIVRTWYDVSRQAMAFAIEHDSFEEVSSVMMIPGWETGLDVEVQMFRQIEKGLYTIE